MNSHKQILDETVEHYRTNPRSFDENGVCQYYTAAGCVCAIGRLAKNAEEMQKATEGATFNGFMLKFLEAKYQRMDFSFLSQLQFLHDNSENWELHENGQKLTQTGKLHYNKIVRVYCKS